MVPSTVHRPRTRLPSVDRRTRAASCPHTSRNDQPKEGNSPGEPTYEWARGNDAELLVGYEQFVPRVLDYLRAARDVINIVEYDWEPTGPSVEIARILKQKACRGAGGQGRAGAGAEHAVGQQRSAAARQPHLVRDVTHFEF